MEMTVIFEKLKNIFKEIIRFFRKKINRLRGMSYIREGECFQCGRCCRMIVLVSEGGIITTEEEFNQLKEVFPEYRRFKMKERDEDGLLRFTCKYVGEDNRCGDYYGRPSICRAYPNEELFVKGGVIASHCGYKFYPVEDFSKVLDQAMKPEDNGKN